MASSGPHRASALEVWGGVECSRVTVNGRIVDQLALTAHDRRSSDISLIADLGVAAVRYPVLWDRVAPKGTDTADWRWSDSRLRALRMRGIRPIVGLLHHSPGPRGATFVDESFVTEFAKFAGAVARRYAWVDAYVPINEALTTARFSGLYGMWYPHARSPSLFATILLRQCLGIRAAARAVRAVNPEARILVNDDVGRNFATPAMAARAAEYNERRWLTWDLLFGRVTVEHPLHELLATTRANRRMLASLADDPCAPDVLGIDHYVTSDRYLDERVTRYPAARRNAAVDYVDVEAVRVRGIPRASISRAIDDTWRRYRRPLALTEISLAGRDTDQVAWWTEAWHAADAARERGVDIRAVTAWAIFGAIDWHCLMTCTDRRYEPGAFDVSVDPIAERRVAGAIRQAAMADPIAPRAPRLRRSRAASAERGWWTMPNRFVIS